VTFGPKSQSFAEGGALPAFAGGTGQQCDVIVSVVVNAAQTEGGAV
jgi:hypothetical protein